ncbi:hypothetical protein CL633_03615 [bacterium]|nr:hypothetical protein [bacterium]|tara:strand:+ start:701 stop:898 length:198 start_codon:yes stop_codon:yes gene_type:complete
MALKNVEEVIAENTEKAVEIAKKALFPDSLSLRDSVIRSTPGHLEAISILAAAVFAKLPVLVKKE